jgi:hypothetical protein
MTSFPIVSPTNMARISRAAPFWLSVALIPLAWIRCGFRRLDGHHDASGNMVSVFSN